MKKGEETAAEKGSGVDSDTRAVEPIQWTRFHRPQKAALRGLLETLYALHLPILEVTKVDR